MAQVIIRDIVKRFGKTEVVHGISLDITDKEFVVLVGPSGCGKSTVLRMVAGLEKITSGTVSIGDRIVNDVAPKDRDVAMVFQNYALYPHMNVFGNMSFGLKLSKTPKAEILERVNEAAAILGLDELLHRKPHELSGGQRQRVAMGRAIVRKPSVFLFDEPLSNLDAKLRTQMRVEIKRLHQKVQSTDHLRHPRPGGSHDPGRPHRGDEKWKHRTGGSAHRTVSEPGQHLRRRLYRQPAHESGSRPHRQDQRGPDDPPERRT